MAIGFPPTTNGTWTTIENREAFQWVLMPLCAFALGTNTLAVASSYAFAKQRRFPVSILCWNAMFNMAWSAFLIMKWAPQSLIRPYFVEDVKLGTFACAVSILIDIASFSYEVACNVLICLTLYLCIHLRKSIDYNSDPRYFWSFVVGLWFWVIAIPTVLAAYKPALGAVTCGPNEKAIYGYAVPNLLLMAIQVYLIGRALWSSHQVIRSAAATQTKKRDVRKIYLLARFTATFTLQVLAVTPYLYNALYNEDHTSTVNNLKINLVLHPLAPALEGIVIICTNRSLISFFKKKVIPSFYTTSGSSNSDTTRKPNQSSEATPTTLGNGMMLGGSVELSEVSES